MGQSKHWTLIRIQRGSWGTVWVAKHDNCPNTSMAHRESCVKCKNKIPKHILELRDFMNKLGGKWKFLKGASRE